MLAFGLFLLGVAAGMVIGIRAVLWQQELEEPHRRHLGEHPVYGPRPHTHP